MNRQCIISRKSELIDIQKRIGQSVAGDTITRWLNYVPFNEITKLSIEEVEIAIDHLPEALDGFSITQLSDFHFTGQIKESYFKEVFRRANDLNSNIIAITGDIVDTDKCLNWIDNTLSILSAKDGVYYIFGNHDKRVSSPADLRKRLEKAGIRKAAGQLHSIGVGSAQVEIAGNEQPWFKEADEVESESIEPRNSNSNTIRILLSHTPDHVYWASKAAFDLMLAGHVHGGQIRFPIFGPIVAPSFYGAAFAMGTFRIGPTTLYVSRGLSGLQPIRWNCPPELTKIILRRR